MKAPFSFVPLLPIAAALAVGILVAESDVVACCVAVAAAFAVGMALRGGGGVVMAASVVIGIAVAKLSAPSIVPDDYVDTSRLALADVKTVSLRNGYSHYDVELLTVPGRPLCKVTQMSSDAGLEIGDRVAMRAVFSLPKNDSVPDARDDEGYLRRQGISLTSILNAGDMVVVEKRPNIFTYAERLRHGVRSAIFASQLSAPTIEFFTAVLLGDDSLLDDSVRKTFSSTGLAHVLALSGLHVGIIAAILSVVLFPLRFMRSRWFYYVAIIVALWLYAFVTGLSASVVRAVVMATCLIVGRLIQRSHSSINSLLFAAILILLFSPMSIYSAGFQMSFASVASILVFANRLNPISTRRRKLRDCVGVVCVSVAAMIGTGIIAVEYFHVFPILFLAANVVVTPVLPILMASGIAVVALSAFGLDVGWLAWCVDGLYSLIIDFAGWLEQLPFASVDNIYLQDWELIPYFMVVAAFALLLYRRRAVYAYAMIAIIAFVAITSWQLKPVFPSEELIMSNERQVTNVIYRLQTRACLITTALPEDRAAVRDRCRKRYADYFGRRGCDSLSIAADSFSLGSLVKRGDFFMALGRSYVLVNDSVIADSAARKVDCAVVCRRFRGNVMDVVGKYKPDTLVISRDVNRRLAKRYADSLAANSVPYKML